MTSEHPRVLVGDEDCLPAVVAGVLYHPGRLEECFLGEAPATVAGVQGRPPARRHEAGPGDPGGR